MSRAQKLQSEPDWSNRKTQSGGLRSLSEGSEIEDGVAIPDPSSSDRANLINSARRPSSAALAYVALGLFFVMVAVVMVTGEMLATLIFCLFVVSLISICLKISD